MEELEEANDNEAKEGDGDGDGDGDGAGRRSGSGWTKQEKARQWDCNGGRDLGAGSSRRL